MKVKDMIKENNALREQMTPFNRSFFEDMILGMRASRVEPLRREELLLEAAKLLLKEQSKGKNAKQVFGENPDDYFKELIDSMPARPVRSKWSHYLMIACAALTCLFGILAAGGLFMLWTNGSADMFGQISLFSLLAVGVGSVIVIELILKWMSSLSESDAPRAKPFDIKSLGIYIGIAVAVIFLGMFLDRLFPVITISPWVSLILCLIGGITLKLVFFKK